MNIVRFYALGAVVCFLSTPRVTRKQVRPSVLVLGACVWPVVCVVGFGFLVRDVAHWFGRNI